MQIILIGRINTINIYFTHTAVNEWEKCTHIFEFDEYKYEQEGILDLQKVGCMKWFWSILPGILKGLFDIFLQCKTLAGWGRSPFWAVKDALPLALKNCLV